MKSIAGTLLSMVMSGTVLAAAAQTIAPAWSPSMLETMRRLQSAALRDNYGYERLAHLSDNIGPRPVGSLQAAAAVDYVAGELRKLGFDVRLEKVRVPRWIRGEDRCELVEYPHQVPGTTQKIVVAALGGLGVATPRDGIQADVVIVNSFAELAALPPDKVARKIVLFNKHFDRPSMPTIRQSSFAITVEQRRRRQVLPPCWYVRREEQSFAMSILAQPTTSTPHTSRQPRLQQKMPTSSSDSPCRDQFDSASC